MSVFDNTIKKSNLIIRLFNEWLCPYNVVLLGPIKNPFRERSNFALGSIKFTIANQAVPLIT